MYYKNVLLHCMSGTGNTFRAASWIEKAAEERGADARIEIMTNRPPADSIPDRPDSLVGVLTPTHGFTAPWLAYRYVSRLPRVKHAHAFCLATRACIKFGPVFLPGISGSGLFILALMLALKGYRVRGLLALDMPSNWIAFHSGLKKECVEAIVERAEPRVKRFSETVFAGNPVWFTRNVLLEFIWGILLSYVSLLYLLIGRFALAKLFFVNERCNGCRLCANQCPVGAIKMVGATNPRPFWKWKCESCMHCMGFCPERAIEASHSWAIVLVKLMSISVIAYLIGAAGNRLPFLAEVNHSWFNRIFHLIDVYVVIGLSYYLFHFLTRIPVINRLFAYSTLTRIYRRYHEPSTRSQDLTSKYE